MPSDRGGFSARVGDASWLPLVGFLGDVDLAEEAAQDAFAIAAERWPRDGMPQHPVAWLVATGRNRAIDRVGRGGRSMTSVGCSRTIG